jgi:autotransporter strand-loop-strand O-heptosyltransferase
MENSFKVNYITTLPKIGNAPRVSISGNDIKTYKVYFYELPERGFNTGKLISSGTCETNNTIMANSQQWFTKWYIEVHDEMDMLVFNDTLRLSYETVFIKLDAHALGDTIAWIPFVEEFRLKHKCKVICSTFWNDLLEEAYPNIMFAKPNTQIANVKTQYYIGASNEDSIHYSPIKVNEHPLQKVATSILGLEYRELTPDLSIKYKFKPRSSPNKEWKVEGGWQGVVNYLVSKGYAVLAISKEPSSLFNVINLSGDGIGIDERAVDIMHAEFHIGVSSGLSWLANALGTHVVMISDVTPNWHEFQYKNTRVNANHLTSVNYHAESQSSLENVLQKLDELVVS